jgi:hypothetical protein
MSLRSCRFSFFFVLFFASSLLAQTFSFQTLTGPSSPADAVAIDVNRDGHPDIVSIDSGGAAVRVYINNGSGGFPQQGSATYSIPSLPIRLITADFDGDGIADLVLISLGDNNCTTPSYSFLHGNGDGTFRAAVTTPLSYCPATLTLTDANGDHIPDIAISDSTFASDTIHILQNDGHATFTEVSAAKAPGLGTIRAVSSGDFNRDGRDDLALVTPGPDPEFLAYVLFNNGNGTYTPRQVATFFSPIPLDMVTADVNGDGAPDMMITMVGSATGIQLVINNGNGTAWTYRTLTFPDVTIDGVTRPVVGNFRLKGLHDVAVGISTTGPSGLPLKAGMAIFPALSATTWGAPTMFTSATANAAGVGPVADFNADGRPDIAFAEGSNRYVIALNTTGVSGCATPVSTPAINVCSPAATTVSPVSISTRARWDGKVITLTRAYVDFKPHCDASGSALTCSATLPKGTHNLTINVWNSTGQVMTSSRTFTVK